MSELTEAVQQLETQRDNLQRGLDVALDKIGYYLSGYDREGGLPVNREAAVRPLREALTFCRFHKRENEDE